MYVPDSPSFLAYTEKIEEFVIMNEARSGISMRRIDIYALKYFRKKVSEFPICNLTLKKNIAMGCNSQ